MSTYSLSAYAGMLSDPVRVEAYEAALREAITPGCTVLEIGTGPGYFAVLACRMGAGLVHAVEPDDTIQVARELAESNGVADRIVFHQRMSTRIDLAEPADVLFSDLRGVLPLFQLHLPTIVDARARLLRPGGSQIPRRDRIWAAPAMAPKLHGECVRPWGANDRDLDLTQTSRRLANTWIKARLTPEQLAAEPQLWTALDYASIRDTNVSSVMEWTIDRDCTLHGLGAWFDTELTEAFGFSNAPDAPRALYGQVFMPFAESLECEAGETVLVDLRAHLVNDDYVWEWRTQHRDTRFSQSTFAGTVLSAERLRRGAEGYTPRLSPEGCADAFVMAAMDGHATVGDIARQLHQEFPTQFSDYRAALDRVSALARARGV